MKSLCIFLPYIHGHGWGRWGLYTEWNLPEGKKRELKKIYIGTDGDNKSDFPLPSQGDKNIKRKEKKVKKELKMKEGILKRIRFKGNKEASL